MSIMNGKQMVPVAETIRDEVWIEPPSLEKLNWLIYLQYARGELTACMTLIEEEIKRTGGRSEFAHYQKGIILKEEGSVQEALESFQTCYKLNPLNTNNKKEIGNCLFLLRRYKLALEAYLEAEKTVEKPDWEICHKLGEILFKTGETASAKEYMRRAVQLGKQESSYDLLINILTVDNDIRSALAVANAALEYCPESVRMLTKSGVLYLKIGQVQNAFERLTAALAVEQDSAPALLALGSIIQSHEEYDSALVKYKAAVASLPESVALWSNIGMCFSGKQKYVAAISCLKRALWFSPLDWKVLYNLGLVHLVTKQYASAFNFLCAAVNLRPDNGLAFMLLGCSLIELQDLENASRALRQAGHLAPTDATVAVNAALCDERRGDVAAAAESYARFCGIADRNPHIGHEVIEAANKLKSAIPADLLEQIAARKAEEQQNEEPERVLEPDEV